MGLVSNMQARLANQHRANANNPRKKMRNMRTNDINKHLDDARKSGKFGDLTNSRISPRGRPKTFKLGPRPKSPPPSSPF